ncbi:glycosyltransferase family 4 protein [Derxia gummosa]|uniref:Glycosyltransferase family 4 protein n=1 Tax=Derxia gummosa DSM 723 TaxID=1121388 RepID=A0A8B6X887_9BURK|nr:glycosyltransferase family 1 protein [Derxia gummosa]
MPPAQLLCDVTRLFRRRADGIGLTGIDRVNLAYANWVLARGGQLCVWRDSVFAPLSARDLNAFTHGFLAEAAAETAGVRRVPAFGLLGRAAGGLGRRVGAIGRRLVPGRAVEGGWLFNVSHMWLDQAAAWAAARAQGLRVATMIHDLIPIDFPEYGRPGEAERHRRRMLGALKHSQALIGNSAATLDDVRRFAARLQLPVPAAVAAPLGHARLPALPPPRSMPSGRPHFLMLGTIEPRKNHLLLLNLWRELVRDLGEAAPGLVIVGRRGWECEQVLDMLDRCEALRGHVLERNDADDGEALGWLAGARALLLPSFAEGFGLPVQEALALGVPVIASPLPVFREIAGDIPDYFGPLDGTGWRAAILDYAAPFSATRAAQLERLTGYRPFSWDGHFREVQTLVD